MLRRETNGWIGDRVNQPREVILELITPPLAAGSLDLSGGRSAARQTL